MNTNELFKAHQAEIERQERLIMILERIEKRADAWGRKDRRKTPRQRYWAAQVWIPMLSEAYHDLSTTQIKESQNPIN
jgi:hypothetical protein